MVSRIVLHLAAGDTQLFQKGELYIVTEDVVLLKGKKMML